MAKKILIIGAIPHTNDLKTYGGTTILMKNFLDYCDEHHYKYQHIDTLKYKNKIANLLHFVFLFLWGVLTSKVVMYNVSRNGAFTIYYYTAPFCYRLRRKVVFRKFGGNFLDQLENCPAKKRLKMVKRLDRASILYFETKKLVREAPTLFLHPERIHWFPNCRKFSGKRVEPHFRKRFVFVSRIEENKGVDQLINVADSLPEDYIVHLYGPLIDQKYGNPDYFKGKRAKYCGALKTEDVLDTLKKYNVLVLPTHWITEGYPGILIEAMSLGLPVIATRIGGIPEMIEEGKNGLLVKPADEKDLRDAILSISKEDYPLISAYSTACFEQNYNSDIMNEKVYQAMTRVAAPRKC